MDCVDGTMQFIKLPNNTNNEITLLPINQPIFFKHLVSLFQTT
jgi:hypothetical protein